MDSSVRHGGGSEAHVLDSQVRRNVFNKTKHARGLGRPALEGGSCLGGDLPAGTWRRR